MQMVRWLALAALPLLGARSYITGFELASVGEFHSSSGTVSIQTSLVRTGTYAMRINTSAASGLVTIRSRAAGGAFRNLFQSVRFYLRIATMPDGDTAIINIRDTVGLTGPYLELLTDGKLRVTTPGPNTATSTSSLSTNTWHLMEFDTGWSSGNGARVYVNSVEFASTSSGAVTAEDEVLVGSGSSATTDLYFDDLLFDDASFATSGFPGAGQVVLLAPISDNSIGTWTGGAGGTSNLFEAVNNIPPAGTATETDTTQIENATNTADQDGLFNCTTYTNGGVGASDTVNAVMAIVNDGEDIATGTKTGGVWVSSNPAQSAGGNSFDYGDDGGALGTFPSGWKTHVGPVAVSPSVTKGSSPVVAIRATSATTRVRSADFLGIYVDYTPNVGGTVVKDPIMRGVVPFPR